MDRLSASTTLPGAVTRPAFDPKTLKPGILHIGLGAFHRAHQAVYNDLALAKEPGDWGIVGCLYTMEPAEIPMAPITMLRNALGVEEGGSGVPLDRQAYRRSVEFWDGNANWRP